MSVIDDSGDKVDTKLKRARSGRHAERFAPARGEAASAVGSGRSLARISAATESLNFTELELAACLVESWKAHRSAPHPRTSRSRAAGRIGRETIAKLATVLEAEPAELLRLPQTITPPQRP